MREMRHDERKPWNPRFCPVSGVWSRLRLRRAASLSGLRKSHIMPPRLSAFKRGTAMKRRSIWICVSAVLLPLSAGGQDMKLKLQEEVIHGPEDGVDRETWFAEM